MVIALAIGHNTPPVGLCLFIACDIGNLKLENLVKRIIPLVITMIAVLIFLSFVPGLVTFLPRLLKS
jgi:C4-dicarboxylate transporter DctM subunit